MRVFWLRAASFLACLCIMRAFAQLPPTPQPGPQPGLQPSKDEPAQTDNGPSVVQPRVLPGDRPPTAEELRQKQIDAFDPLAKKPDDDPDASPAPAPLAKPAAQTPLPGSVAESNQANALRTEGPQVIGSDDSIEQQYNGPAVLSRSYTLTRPTVPKQVRWSWTVGASQNYTSGLLGGVPAAAGQTALPSVGAFGSTATFAFQGRHLWKRDEIGATYSGAYNDYTGARGYSGLNQVLNLDYSHAFSRHLQLNVVESGSILTQSGTLLNPVTDPGVSVANINLAASPTIQALDLTTRQSTTQVSLTWQKSARLSFNYSAGLFGVDRTGPQLYGDSGFQGQTDVNYRITRKTTIGVYYSYVSYVFSHHFADSDTNTVGLIYSHSLGRSAQLRTRLGISRIENLGLTQVPINPVIAVLIGQPFGIVDSYNLSYTSDTSAQFVKDFGERRTASISYAHGVSPGNGSILTATQESFGASVNTSLFRHFILALALGQTTLSATLQTIGKNTSDYATVSLSRMLRYNVSANLAFSYRKYQIVGAEAVAPQWVISSGVSWGPGEGKLW